MVIDQELLEQILAENPAVNPTDYSTGLTNMSPDPSLDELMAQASQPSTNPYNNNPYRAAPPMPVRPLNLPQRQDPETMNLGRPAPRPQGNPIPLMQRIKEHMASSGAAWQNVFGGMGRRGRTAPPADLSAPFRAEAALRNQYLQEQQGRESSNIRKMMADLQRRKIEHSLQPKPVDPIARAQALMNLQKTGLEVTAEKQKQEKSGKEDEYKKELVDMINGSGKVSANAASMSMSKKTLESMAKDIGLSELDLKKARAAGGIRDSVYSSSKSPEVTQALRRNIKEDLGKFMSPSENDAMDAIMDSNLPAKTKKEYVEKFEKRGMENEKRARDTAEATLQTIYDKDRNTIEIYTKLNMLQKYIDSHPKMEGYDRLTSTGRQLPFGTAAIKAITDDPEVIKLFTLIDGVEQAFARAKSGSAINAGEWVKFKDELGSGALSDAKQLGIGVRTMRKGIQKTVENEWQRVPGSIRYEDQYLERLGIFGIKEPKNIDELADKYKAQ